MTLKDFLTKNLEYEKAIGSYSNSGRQPGGEHFAGTGARTGPGGCL